MVTADTRDVIVQVGESGKPRGRVPVESCVVWVERSVALNKVNELLPQRPVFASPEKP